MTRLLQLVPSLVLLLAAAEGLAERVSDVRNTKHNLSLTGPGPVKALTETQVCVFCHTPHGANTETTAPLWNRALSGATYTPYTSSSIDADDIAANPGGSSKLCLSCHDGTLAIGAVNVANGQADVTFAMEGTGPGGTMPAGPWGEQTGFTRKLGVNLTNDHPISFTYSDSLALADGELRSPSASPHIGNRAPGFKPSAPLEQNKLECVSCHDPHIRDSDPAKNIKFLRLNRFQQAPPAGSVFSEATDIVCLACHDKLGQTWATSAHADPLVADEIYKDGPADLREFPRGTAVWEASCLNCHDTHTVQGAQRLLREGTDATGGPAQPRSGGSPALESVCYQCHTNSAKTVLASSTQVPDIESEFALPKHMPITDLDQGAAEEVHDVLNADLEELQLNLGQGDLTRRHAECTDCHNPHRLQRNTRFNGSGNSNSGAHDHAFSHSNIASGVLRGAWGVEPEYGSASFQNLPSGYLVKKGDGGAGASELVNSPWVTREYQICLKCHSDFGYADNNIYPTGNRPDVTISGGANLTQYTNQAKEFQAPLHHRGQVSTADSGAGLAFSINNHRSWHPVIGPTGRDSFTRTNGTASISNNWLPPWNSGVGTQTMYCSDCHGNNFTGVAGPHGSTFDFILRGRWDNETGTGASNDLCFQCHDYDCYANERGICDDSGFGRGDNLHTRHFQKIGRVECTWCHIAVPHGWKNKALLVNLNDVGPEAGLPPGTEVSINSSGQSFTQEPYYWQAKLKVVSFAQSGDWRPDNCGSLSGSPDPDKPTGTDWMKTVCSNPP